MSMDSTNPYVGLRPFEMDESILFFGRSEQTLELLQRLHQHHFVAVVGSSGCGKSSLLRAGLIPALKAGYLVQDSDHWMISIMKPGQSPLHNLAESILNQLTEESDDAAVSSLVQKINEDGADAILNFIAPLRQKQNVNFFLLVDQFEELFRFAMDKKNMAGKEEAIDFVNIILELAGQSSIAFYVVLTMRSDFIGDCDQFYGLPEAMNKSQYLVPRLPRIQLKNVIEGPARLYGGKLNPALISRLLNELSKVKDELPLLQHCLMRIWNQEMTDDKNGEIDLDDYQNIGGIEKALNDHADEALKGMSKEDLLITKKIFQALTTIDENGRKIRKPVLLSQLSELTGATEDKLLIIITLFIQDRRSFLIISKAGEKEDKIIDISHESLIRQWDTLSQWVDEEGESASIYKKLAEYTASNQKKKKLFLDDSELKLFQTWYDDHAPVAAWANRYQAGFDACVEYLNASKTEQTRLINKDITAFLLQEVTTISPPKLLTLSLSPCRTENVVSVRAVGSAVRSTVASVSSIAWFSSSLVIGDQHGRLLQQTSLALKLLRQVSIQIGIRGIRRQRAARVGDRLIDQGEILFDDPHGGGIEVAAIVGQRLLQLADRRVVAGQVVARGLYFARAG